MGLFDIKPTKPNKKSKIKIVSFAPKAPKLKPSKSTFNIKPVSFVAKPNQPKMKNLIFGYDHPKPARKVKGKLAMTWPQAKKRFPEMNPFGDRDRDGVQNWLDCKPFDKKRQAWDVEARKKKGYKVQMMSPKIYLKKTKTDPYSKNPEEAEHAKVILNTFADHDKLVMTKYGEKHKSRPIKHLSKYIKDPKVKVSIPYIGDTFADHEGRHRAYAAALAGEKVIPVVVPTPKEWRTKEVARKFVDERFKERRNTHRDYPKWEHRLKKEAFPQQLMDEESIESYKKVLKDKGLMDLDNEVDEPFETTVEPAPKYKRKSIRDYPKSLKLERYKYESGDYEEGDKGVEYYKYTQDLKQNTFDEDGDFIDEDEKENNTEEDKE